LNNDEPINNTFYSGELLDLGGTLRTQDAAQTIANAQKIFNKIGITRVANVTGLDHVGIPTWIAVRPLAKSLSVSQGKGITDELAKASGIMECIEIFHAENFVPRGHKASLSAVFNRPGYVNPLLLPLRIDADLDNDLELEWIKGVELNTQSNRWLPRELIDLDFTQQQYQTPCYFLSSSNGLASGNTREEALIHALCEVIERDQISFWLVESEIQSSRAKTRLKIDTIDDSYCLDLIEKCNQSGLEILVWYTTHNLQLPCFVCVVYDKRQNTFYPQRASGAGCHLRKNVALSRAITEALQSRLTHISGGRDDVYWSRYKNDLLINSEEKKQILDTLSSTPELVDFTQIAEPASTNTTESFLDIIKQIFCDNQLPEIIVVDLTREDYDIPVVHVTVPGLEGSAKSPLYTPGPRMKNFMQQEGII